MSQEPTPLAGLDQLIADAKKRLAANPDYIALKAFEKARAEILGIKGVGPTPVAVRLQFEEIEHIDDSTSADSPSAKKVSQLAGAAQALEHAGHPLPIKELMERAEAAGAVIGGDNKQVNFGSSLSKSDKFRSVKWKGDRS